MKNWENKEKENGKISVHGQILTASILQRELMSLSKLLSYNTGWIKKMKKTLHATVQSDQALFGFQFWLKRNPVSDWLS